MSKNEISSPDFWADITLSWLLNPICEPVFVEFSESRVPIISKLSHISGRRCPHELSYIDNLVKETRVRRLYTEQKDRMPIAIV